MHNGADDKYLDRVDWLHRCKLGQALLNEVDDRYSRPNLFAIMCRSMGFTDRERDARDLS